MHYHLHENGWLWLALSKDLAPDIVQPHALWRIFYIILYFYIMVQPHALWRSFYGCERWWCAWWRSSSLFAIYRTRIFPKRWRMMTRLWRVTPSLCGAASAPPLCCGWCSITDRGRTWQVWSWGHHAKVNINGGDDGDSEGWGCYEWDRQRRRIRTTELTSKSKITDAWNQRNLTLFYNF